MERREYSPGSGISVSDVLLGVVQHDGTIAGDSTGNDGVP